MKPLLEIFGASQDTEIYASQYMLWRKNPKYRFLNFLADNPLDDNYPNCLDKLKWYKLSNLEIKDKKGKWIRDYRFSYNDNASQRLILQSVSEFVWEQTDEILIWSMTFRSSCPLICPEK